MRECRSALSTTTAGSLSAWRILRTSWSTRVSGSCTLFKHRHLQSHTRFSTSSLTMWSRTCTCVPLWLKCRLNQLCSSPCVAASGKCSQLVSAFHWSLLWGLRTSSLRRLGWNLWLTSRAHANPLVKRCQCSGSFSSSTYLLLAVPHRASSLMIFSRRPTLLRYLAMSLLRSLWGNI
jgi:hypothetical protein